MDSNLQKEFEYYKANQAALVAKYDGKFIVIRNCEVLGSYDSETQAITETSKTHPLGTFFVVKCEAGKDSYTQTFHSRVTFAPLS